VNRALFLITFASIGALAFGWWTNYQDIQDAQDERLKAFLNAGPRFTAYDGQELCEFQNVIAKHSIGFQQSGLPLLDCGKYTRNRVK
jgi:hypothetical protein